VGLSDSGKKGTVRNVSGVANTVNITSGGAVVKPVLKIYAQGRQAVLTLGVVEVDDKQAGTGMDTRPPCEAKPA
jgi:hypothetical protein